MGDTWRAIGKQTLPELRDDFNDDETTPYLALTTTKDLTLSALRDARTDLASRAFSYAEWCRSQEQGDVRNAAFVCFYEYIFDDDLLEMKVARFIPKSIFQDILNFVAFRYEESPEKFRRIKSLYDLQS